MKRLNNIEQLELFIQAFEYAPGYIHTSGLSEMIIDFIENELGYTQTDMRDVIEIKEGE
mgnify:CR=1 FL=1